MNMESTEENIRKRNSLYRDISGYFNVTLDNVHRVIEATRRVFGRLKCNRVDPTDIIRSEFALDKITARNNFNENKNSNFATKSRTDCYIVDNAPNGGMPLLIRKAESDMSNVTFIQVQPCAKNSKHYLFASNGKIKPTFHHWNPISKAKRLFGMGKTMPSNDEHSGEIEDDLEIEDLEYDAFWRTTKDANMIM